MIVELGEGVRLERSAIRFPVELRIPAGFDSANQATWPRVEGRLEYVGGRLLYMPPSGDVQQDVVADVAFVLRTWRESHPEFVVGTNEAGMILGDDTRGADAAVWRRSDLGERTGGYRRVAPVLAVEVAGQDEEETTLREKAKWYLDHGVKVVWLVLPESRSALVLAAAAEHRVTGQAPLPPHASLPGLAPSVAQFFAQL